MEMGAQATVWKGVSRGAALTAACLSLLALVPAAAGASSKGVYDVFGSLGSATLAPGGAFRAGSGAIGTVAVNSIGAGGVNAGDVYIADSANNRIQSFDKNGNFLRAWGLDVDSGGGTGFEVCVVAASCKTGLGQGAGGGMSSPNAVAVNQQNGNVYIADKLNRRVDEFSATGTFLRAWGKDVVNSGAEQADEQQRLTVDATGGQYKLTFGANTTADIEWNESAAGIEAKLNALASINSGGGSVAVSGGPGGVGSTTPYRISFAGARADTNQPPLVVAAGTTPLNGGTGTATIATLRDGAVGFEVCETAANCQAGSNGATGGAFDSVEGLQGIAVAPAGAPNAGDVLVADSSGNNDRVQEFSPTGLFVRAFAWDVVASGPDDTAPVNQFEVCRAAELDICKRGAGGAGTGQFSSPSFGSGPNQLAEDASGNLYTVESSKNFRVQRFVVGPATVSPAGLLDPGQLSGNSSDDTPFAVAVDTSAAPGTTAGVYVLKSFPVGTAREARVLEVDPAAAGGEGEVLSTFAARGGIGSGQGGLAVGLALDTSSGRLFATSPVNGGEINREHSFAYIIDGVPGIETSDVEASDVGSSTAALKATIAPAALPHLHTLYRFEYAKAGTAGSCGEGAAGWSRAPSLEADVGNGSPVEVQAAVSNLDFEATYDFCLVAHTQFNGAEALITGPPFTTHPTPPVVDTGMGIWSSPPATGPSLLLGGTVNPGHARTTYRFEYVPQSTYQADLAAIGEGFEHAAAVPVPAAEAGRGVELVPVRESVAGLDPGIHYVFRLVATNETGTRRGAVHSVAPPNASDRFYELVSAGSSWGSGTSGIVGDIAPDGDRAGFTALAFGQPSSLPGVGCSFLASRASEGWTVSFMGPEATSVKTSGTVACPGKIAADLESALWAESSFSELERGEVKFGLVRLDGTRSTAFGPLVPLIRSGRFQEYSIEGATPDLTSFVFTAKSRVTFLPGEPMVSSSGSSNLYQVVGGGTASSTFRIVNRGSVPNASNPLGVIGGRCGAGLGGSVGTTGGVSTHAISDGGSAVYFSARPGEPQEGNCSSTAPRRIFKRSNGETTVEISASQCTPACSGSPAGDDTYQGASADGRIAFFTTNRQLVNSDTDSTNDLYVYDAGLPEGHQLVQASAGETVGSHATGNGAKVLGVLDIAADGSRVYFVAEGVLSGENAEQKAPLPGQPNLYAYNHASGRTTYVGALDGGVRVDSNGNDIGDPAMLWSLRGPNGSKEAYALPVEGTGDGRFLLFTSFAELTTEDLDDAKDVYRYDAGSETMLCLSCVGTEASFDAVISPRPVTSDPDLARVAPPASADVSTVVFTTAEPLLPEDQNEGKNLDCTANANDIQSCDVYAWREGRLSLISGGTEAFGVTHGISMSGISGDGRNVFFTTRAQLVAADTNNAIDVYDARVDGGFPVGAAQARCTGSEECQGPTQASPAASQPGTATFAGSGNPALPPPKPCRKGLVRRGGKCVKKPRHRKQHKKKQQRANRRTGSR
jgi:hypothetical protein